MNKKRVVGFILILLLINVFAFSTLFAAEDDTVAEDTVADEGLFETATTDTSDLSDNDKAYDCLEESVKNKGYENLNSVEQSFAMLALAYDSSIQGELRTALADSSYENLCWPADGCEIKDTALALIALDYINAPTNEIENWLLNEDQTKEPSDLSWFLQIDSSQAVECRLVHEGGSVEVDIGLDKKIIGSGGSCFSRANDGYWLEVDEDCYGEDLEISCDKDFITSVAYKKKSGSSLSNPYYISSVTHAGVSGGTTTEKINSLCFKKSNSCDYEGTLWATLALKKVGKDTSAFIPYLIATSSNNEQYIPQAFLYMLTGYDEYFLELVNKQKSGGYWQTSSDTNSRYYDTALALLALYGYSANDQIDLANEFLVENQQLSGCWNSIRDTSFILYATDPKNPVLLTQRENDCKSAGGYCIIGNNADCEDAFGTVMSNYECSSPGIAICCSKYVEAETPDTSGSSPEENECEERGNFCRSFCSANEEVKPYECGVSGNQECCGTESASTKEGGSYWWIWLLLILIILLVLAIVYRNQLKIWLFKVKNKFKKGPATQQSRPNSPAFPSLSQQGPGQRMMPRRILPGQRPPMPGRPMQRPPMQRPMPGRPPARSPFPKEDKLQETLRKLKGFGK